MTETKPHKRVNDILLGPLERPALQWLAAHMPAWMSPDILTFIGIIGAIFILVGYLLSNNYRGFLWLATLGFIINWFGDSLDGTLARYRKIERPKYGFFVDHTVDAFSQVLIFSGIGLSPYLSFEVAIFALIGYLLVSIYVYVDTYVSGLFKISYGKLGPTEVRLIAVLANTVFFFWGVQIVETPIGSVIVYDFFGLAIAAILFFIFISSTVRRALELSKLDKSA